MTTAPEPLPWRGDGVVLRRLGLADLAAFQAYRTDAELGRFQGWSAMSDAQARSFLDEMSQAPLWRPGHWAQIAIAEPQNLALAGDIGLFLAEDARHVEIGFTLARHAQGRGLGTAAVRGAIQLVFSCTAVERVVGITDARNHASIALLDRLGMRRTQERSVEFRGEQCVEHVYVLPRGDG